jgi:hypothetical protein
MNERIRQLALQAGYDWQWDTQIDFGHKEMEKFAELIIKECAEIARVFSVEGVEYDGGDAIREHFGVER